MPTFKPCPHHDFYDVILPENEFNNWIAVIDTMARNSSSWPNPHRQFILLGIKESMFHYSRFNNSNRSASVRLSYDEVLTIETTFAELSPNAWMPNVKSSFQEAISDPDQREWVRHTNDWDEFWSNLPFHNNLTELAVGYLKHWKELGIPLDLVLLSIAFKESVSLHPRAGDCIIDWERMNHTLENYAIANPII